VRHAWFSYSLRGHGSNHLSAGMGQTTSNFGGYLNSPHKGCAHNRVIAVMLETIAINASDRATRTMRTTPQPSNQVWSSVHSIRGTPLFQLPVYTFKIATRHGVMMAPPASSLPLPRWAWGPLWVPCRLGTLAYKHEAKVKGRMHYRVLTHVLWPRMLPPSWGGLRC
jgi:hypothetical protein